MNEITKAKLVEYMGHLPAAETKRKIDYELMLKLLEAGYTPLEISRQMKVSRATVEYRRKLAARKHYELCNQTP